MTIIVTGGAGFIGSNFIFYMLKEHPQDRIVCLDSLTYAGNLSTLAPVMDQPNFCFVKLDICDRPGVYTLFEEEKPDVIVNFAAESHVDRSIENPEVFLQTNIIGTSVLMDACRKYGISRYHQVSTDDTVKYHTYGIIRYPRMRYTEICHWTVRICSFMKIRRSIPPARTVLPRHLRICLLWHITERTACR